METFNAKRYDEINKEVDNLLKAGFIRIIIYPRWVANIILIKKPNKKWRVCVDYTNLNKTYPKDSFPIPRINQSVDATIGYELLTFIDA